MLQEPLNAVTLLKSITSIVHLFDQSCVPSDTCQQIVGMTAGQFCIWKWCCCVHMARFPLTISLYRLETTYYRSEFLLCFKSTCPFQCHNSPTCVCIICKFSRFPLENTTFLGHSCARNSYIHYFQLHMKGTLETIGSIGVIGKMQPG